MAECLVIGLTEAGQLRFGSSTTDTARIVLMLEIAKYDVIKDTMGD